VVIVGRSSIAAIRTPEKGGYPHIWRRTFNCSEANRIPTFHDLEWTRVKVLCMQSDDPEPLGWDTRRHTKEHLRKLLIAYVRSGASDAGLPRFGGFLWSNGCYWGSRC
jgi:hypothetical protein